MAQIIERGKGRYLVRVFLGRDPTSGKRKYHNKTIRGAKKQAEAYGRKIQHQVDTGVYRETGNQTVAGYLDDWLKHTARDKVRPKTLEGYRDIARTHLKPVVGEIRLEDLTPQDVQKVVTSMKEKGRSPRTIRNSVGVLRNALKRAVKHGVIPSNPAEADMVDFPKGQKRTMTVLDQEQAQGFVEAAREQGAAGALYIVLLGTGMRPGEALGLGWEHYDGKALRVERALTWARNDRDWRLAPPKTENSLRTIPLPGFAREALNEQRRRQAEQKLKAGPEWADHGLIFTGETGEPLRWRTLARREFTWILQEADLPTIRPYDLRHTCASLLLASGVNPKVVSERLGHSTVALTLNTYSAVLPGLQEEATAKLGEMIR